MSDPLDRYLDGFGADVRRATTRRRRRRTTTGAVAAAATATACAVLLTGGAASPRLDAVAEARAALAPAGEVVHLRITATTELTGERIALPRDTTEQWTAVDPPRWRFVQTLSRGRSRGTFSDTDGRRIVGRQEFAYADGRQSSYAVELRRLTVNTGYDEQGPAARPPGPLGGDPATDLRAMLGAGEVTDQGLVDSGGRRVRRLVSVVGGTRGRPSRRLTYEVDSDTFAPVRGVLRTRFTPRLVSTATFVVDRYERLPLTAQTAKLLRITTRPGTTVTTVTAADRARRLARIERGCVRDGIGYRCPRGRVRRP